MIEFARPGLLWALPAAALPVLIHLLNRRRYRRVPWGAMAHLVAAERRSRRRVRVQNALVLALRTAAVVLLVLLFAQPGVSRRLAGPGPGPGGHAFLLLDDSASMARVHDGTRAFDQAVGFASAVAEELADGGAALTAFVASEADPFFTAAPLRGDDLAELRGRLAALAPAASAFEPGARLAALGDAAAGALQGRFYVLTDLQASNWGGERLAPAAADALRALQQRGPVRIVDVGAPSEAGVGVVDILDGGRPAYAGTASAFRAVLDNASPEPREPTPLDVRVDGQALPPAEAPALPAGQRREALLELYLEEPGYHWLDVAVRARDGFAPDDRRCFAFEVVEELPVLVVEGGAAAEPAEAPGFYLRAALQAAGGRAPGVRVANRRAELGAPDDLARYAAVFLCGVRSPEAWDAPLRRYVAEGGRLIVFLDDAADARAYGRTLLGEDGPLPCRPGGLVRAAPGQAFHLAAMAFSDPLLRPFAGWEALFGMVRFRAFHKAAPVGAARVLARFDDADSSPALLVAEAGRGQVVLVPCTANDAWTDWPRSEAGRVTYVPLMYWLAEQGATGPRRRGCELNLPAGACLEFPLDSARFRTDATLRPPEGGGGSAPAVVRLQARPRADREGLWLLSGPLTRAGVHELRLVSTSGERESVYFAVHVPERERLPARTPREAVEAAVAGPGRLSVVGYEQTGESPPSGAGAAAPLWPHVAAAVLVVLLAESVLAWRFGNPRGATVRARGRQGGAA